MTSKDKQSQSLGRSSPGSCTPCHTTYWLGNIYHSFIITGSGSWKFGEIGDQRLDYNWQPWGIALRLWKLPGKGMICVGIDWVMRSRPSGGDVVVWTSGLERLRPELTWHWMQFSGWQELKNKDCMRLDEVSIWPCTKWFVDPEISNNSYFSSG